MTRILPGSGPQKEISGASLVQRLGYAADARLLILTADEFGECHAANIGVMRCWEAGLLKSVTWLAPAPWAPEAAEYVRKHPEMDVGVHLTLATGPVAGMGWRPLLSRTAVPGLYNPDGYLWPYGTETWKHATADEVKRESRAQIEKAIHMGIDPTHLDPHDGIFNLPADMGSHVREFAKLYGELAKEFSLPVRLSYTRALLAERGLEDMPAIISKQGVLMNDEGLMCETGDSYRKIFHERAPGTVTEMYIHAAVDCPELRAVRNQRDWWKVGVDNLQLFTEGREEVRRVIKEEGFTVIGWREIRDLQRRGR
jgi:hypothetical protein